MTIAKNGPQQLVLEKWLSLQSQGPRGVVNLYFRFKYGTGMKYRYLRNLINIWTLLAYQSGSQMDLYHVKQGSK